MRRLHREGSRDPLSSITLSFASHPGLSLLSLWWSGLKTIRAGNGALELLLFLFSHPSRSFLLAPALTGTRYLVAARLQPFSR